MTKSAEKKATAKAGGKPNVVTKRRLRTKSTIAKPPKDNSVVSGTWLLDIDPKDCFQCDQSTHDFDQHDKASHVRWHKFAKTAAGEQRPSGAECYVCFFVRRKYWGIAVSSTALKECRRTSEEENTRFNRLREDAATGAHTYSEEAITNTRHTIEKKDEDFDEGYDVGTFKPLTKFCVEQGLDPKLLSGVAAMQAFVKEKYPAVRA